MIGGVVLDTSALQYIAAGSTIYGQAFVAAASSRGVILLVPSTCLSQVWSTAPAAALPLLELLLDLPVVVVDDMDATAARGAGLGLREANLAPDVALTMTAEAHVVRAATSRGWRVLSRGPERLWAIDSNLVIETPPPE